MILSNTWACKPASPVTATSMPPSCIQEWEDHFEPKFVNICDDGFSLIFPPVKKVERAYTVDTLVPGSPHRQQQVELLVETGEARVEGGELCVDM